MSWSALAVSNARRMSSPGAIVSLLTMAAMLTRKAGSS